MMNWPRMRHLPDPRCPKQRNNRTQTDIPIPDPTAMIPTVATRTYLSQHPQACASWEAVFSSTWKSTSVELIVTFGISNFLLGHSCAISFYPMPRLEVIESPTWEPALREIRDNPFLLTEGHFMNRSTMDTLHEFTSQLHL